MSDPKKYRPSNSDEGFWFIDEYCKNCIHGKYEHTCNTDDNPCDILTRSFFFGVEDKEYPEEWTYDENKNPVCTAFKKWDWGKDDDGNFIDPPPLPFDDPNQLVFPFIFDEIGVPKTQKELA